MGERWVNISLVAPATNKVQPTVRREIVKADDPRKNIVNCDITKLSNDSQLVSLKLNPTNRQTTPPTIKPSPMKSNSSMCSRSVLPLWGFKLRKKNRRAAAKPPVGLHQSHLRLKEGLIE